MPGQLSQPFLIRNISDGGALLVFDDALIPSRSFRIEIEGTEFVLLCEVVHQGPHGVGVKFMRVSEGAALNRYFQLKPIEGLKDVAGDVAPLAEQAVPRLCSQELRQALRIVTAEEPDAALAAAVPVVEAALPHIEGPAAPVRRWQGAALALWILGAGLAVEEMVSRATQDVPRPVAGMHVTPGIVAR